jgi:alkanesulfonate monooxygenase SsuD/methylene tetrahydromethanopterin reductase-like flavin-dependent oxidoreductase (luciferase family)
MIYYLLQTGRLTAVPTVDTATRFLAEQLGDARSVPPGRRFIVGSPATVKAAIEDVAHEYGADEVMIVTIVHDHQARRRCYELIAQTFGMAAAAP